MIAGFSHCLSVFFYRLKQVAVSKPTLPSSGEEGAAVATEHSQPHLQAVPKVLAPLLVDKTPGPESWDHQLANGVGGKPVWAFGGPAQACSGSVALGRSPNLSGLSHHTGLYFSEGRIRMRVMSGKTGAKEKTILWKEIDI